MENAYKNNDFDMGTIFKEALEMLKKGIAKVCYYPVAALDKDGQLVSLVHPTVCSLTPSGAIIKAIKNHFKDGEDIEGKISYCINKLAKQFPKAFIFNYEPAVSVDLACLKISDKEILSGFDTITRQETTSYL